MKLSLKWEITVDFFKSDTDAIDDPYLHYIYTIPFIGISTVDFFNSDRDTINDPYLRSIYIIPFIGISRYT